MKKIILPILFMLVACTAVNDNKPHIILDTDLGNDIDDVEAIVMLYNYLSCDSIDLMAICLNKTGDLTAKYLDILSTFYGYQDIPVGMIKTDKSTGCPAEDCYTGRVCNLDLFPTTHTRYDTLPEAYRLYRELLSKSEDHSVTVLSVGFLSNLALLMESQADDISPLTGMELISQKVKQLVIMAGRFKDEVPEFNIMVDIPASQKIMSQWPSEIAILTWELGDQVHYPYSHIENDYNWTQAHPFKEAYIRYAPVPYNNIMFDPTAAVYAAGDTAMFTAGPYGKVDVDDKGVTRFTEGNGKTRIMYLSDKQAQDILNLFIDKLPRKLN